MSESIKIALSKGRIFDDTLPMLADCGIEPLDDANKTRKLILDTNRPDVKLVLIRATDVPTYVQFGAADLGVTGKDVLDEHGGEGMYELLDLRIAICRMMVAGKENTVPKHERIRVATKFVNTAKRYYAAKGQQVDIIKLYGSMELAPIVDLADYIVDLVSTGGTLKANGLVPLEHISDISSRLVVNKAAMKMKHATLAPFIAEMKEAVAARNSK